jgi:AraC-like DNA-binding protein
MKKCFFDMFSSAGICHLKHSSNKDLFILVVKESIFSAPLVPDGYARVGPIRNYPRVLADLGVQPKKVLAPFQLDETFFQNPDNILPLSTRGALFVEAVKKTGCEHIGLLIGQHAGAAELGTPGRLLLASPTVGIALDRLACHFHLNCRSAMAVVRLEGNEAMLGYMLSDGNLPAFQELQDGVLAVALNLMRQIISPDWTPRLVHMMRRTPSHPEVYERFFGAPCVFDQPRSELVFPTETLDLPVAYKLPEFASQEPLPRSEEIVPVDESSIDWICMVRRMTIRMLMNGECTQQAIARELGVSTRTLNRNVERLGSSYREIVDYCRYTISRNLMRETDMSLTEVATVLGYVDHSTFHRAFKRWSGQPPSVWRRLKVDRSAGVEAN